VISGIFYRLDKEKGLVCVLLVAFFVTGLAYSLVVPAFETPDEIYHYAFARHLAAGNGLGSRKGVSLHCITDWWH